MKSLLGLLQNRKTFLGALLLSLLGAVSSLDLLLHDGAYVWLTGAQYASIGTIIGGLTGVAMRIAVGKAASANQLLMNLLEVAAGELHAAKTVETFNNAATIELKDNLKKDA